MSDKFEILRFRRTKGSTPTFLQICWCAAMKKNFVGPGDIYKVTSEEADSVNFIQLCSDIQKMLFNHESRIRFNLTIGSQLTYGTLRIFEYQTVSLEEKSDKLLSSMDFDFDCGTGKKDEGKKKNAKKNKSPIEKEQSFSIDDFSDVDINELFGGDEYRKDEHVIEEIDQFLKSELECNFQGSEDAASDIEKVMQELYEEMQRPQRRSRKATQENSETNQPDVLRQPDRRRSRRLSRTSTTESAKTAVTPPLSQKSGFSQQLQNSEFVGATASQVEQQLDAPQIESEALPEVTMPDEPPLSQSSIIATTALVTPPPPLPEINVTADSVDPQESFPMIEEGDEEVHINEINNFDRSLVGKNVIIDEVRQIELPNSTPSPHLHAKKKPTVKINLRKQTVAQMKRPAKTLLSIPSMSIGLGKTSTTSKLFMEDFTNTILSRERTLKTWGVTAEFANVEEPQRIEEEVMEHSPPKIIKTRKSKVCKPLKSNSEPEVPPDTTIPVESNEFEPPAGPSEPPEPPEPMETNNVEISELQVEDNDCGNRTVANKWKGRKQSSSFSEDDEEDEPKSKQPKVQESNEDSQFGPVKDTDDIFRKIKSFWRRMFRASKGRKGASGKIKVSFTEIVPPIKSKITDVINCLTLCFHLESDRKIAIEQEKPYGPLYLVKPLL